MGNTLLSVGLLATANNMFEDAADVLVDMFEDMWEPLVAIAAALAVVWGVYLGIKFWLSSGDENKRKEAKSAIISFVVGTVIIFAVAVGAPVLIASLAEWLSDSDYSALDGLYDVASISVAGGMQYLAAA